MSYSTDDVKLALKILKHLTKGDEPELKITTNHEPDPVPIAKLIRKYIQASSKTFTPVEKKVMSPEKFIERHNDDYSDDVETLDFQKCTSRIDDALDVIRTLPSVDVKLISEINGDLNNVAMELEKPDKLQVKLMGMKLNEMKRTVVFLKKCRGDESILHDLNCVNENLYGVISKAVKVESESDESESDESESDESNEE